MIDVIRELHCTGLGWISSYPNVPSEDLPKVNMDSINANASRMQNEFGYRFLMSEFTSQTFTEPGSKLDFSFKVTNTASAPFYYKWPVAVVLIDETTSQIKEKIIIPDIDITSWHPGDKYNYTTRTYQIPAVNHTISGSVDISGSLPIGNYLISISILEPNSKSPGIFFAVENFFKENQTQPLARMGIGENADTHTREGVRFDDPKANDVRYYTSSTTDVTYTATITPPVNGSISIPDGPYPANSNIYVTAMPDSGYVFSHWGGDLAGLPNPAILAIDGNKNILVSFRPVGSERNLFINGDFSSGNLLGWLLSTVSSSTATASVINEECLVDISHDDGMHWHISLMQYKITLIRGVRYTLKFKARAESDRTISTQAQLNNAPWTTYQNSVVPITTTMDSYSITWVQTETNSNSKIGFFLGSQGTNNVWIDDVELYPDGSATAYTFTTNATNGSITFNPAGGTYDAGTTVIVTATPAAGYKFTGWSGDLLGTNNPVSLLMDKDANVTANFSLITYSLSVIANNGTVSMDPAGGAYVPVAVVTLTATPKAGYMFIGWSGDLTGSTNPATITIDKNKRVTANFLAITYTLTTSASNGSVSRSPAGGSYNAGTQVTLTANPDAGYVFDQWSGDLSGDQNPTLIIMNNDKSITAIFSSTLNSALVNGEIAGLNRLGQNFPNPFSIETTIPFELKEASNIKISVINMLRQEVRIIIDDHLPPGNHTIQWDGRDKNGKRVAEGLYFYQMNSDQYSVQTRKLFLLP